MPPTISPIPHSEDAADVEEEAAPGVLFTPGPVMLEEETLEIGRSQMVYHRTEDFSARILRCEEGLKAACLAEPDARVVLLTASGTGAMEAALINLFGAGDRLLVVNGGDFGARFVEICRVHGLPVTEIRLEPGCALRDEDLAGADPAGCTGLVINHHETSTGCLHDVALASRFCREHGLLLVVDAIGSFLADPLNQEACSIDALILSSQKGLALPPGLSFIVLSARAAERARRAACRSYYLNFARYLEDGARGQTPFTPAVQVIRQLEARLERVLVRGVDRIVAETAALAADFRGRIARLPFRIFPDVPSNAVTALLPLDGRGPSHCVRRLAEEHGLFVCPNGGALGRRIFRVGHLGALTPDHNARLAGALTSISMEPAAGGIRKGTPS